MKTLIKAALIASSLSLMSAAAAPAFAASISLNFGNVAVGYSDGYWDNSHHWHRWAHASDARAYQARFHDNYHAMRHDRAPHMGWNR